MQRLVELVLLRRIGGPPAARGNHAHDAVERVFAPAHLGENRLLARLAGLGRVEAPANSRVTPQPGPRGSRYTGQLRRGAATLGDVGNDADEADRMTLGIEHATPGDVPQNSPSSPRR